MSYSEVKYVRAFVKASMGLAGQGASSRDIESRTMSLSRALRAAMTDTEKTQACANVMPTWLKADVVQQLFRDPELDLAPPPPCEEAATPAVDPAVDLETYLQQRCRYINLKKGGSRAVDVYLQHRRPALQAKAVAMKANTIKYKRSTIESLIKMLGGREWRGLPQTRRDAYVACGKARVVSKASAVSKTSEQFVGSAPLRREH